MLLDEGEHDLFEQLQVLFFDDVLTLLSQVREQVGYALVDVVLALHLGLRDRQQLLEGAPRLTLAVGLERTRVLERRVVDAYGLLLARVILISAHLGRRIVQGRRVSSVFTEALLEILHFFFFFFDCVCDRV